MESEFEGGDQDYTSAMGWDPGREQRERLLAEAMKKNPRAFSPVPEMLYVRSIKECLEVCTRGGPVKQLFGPLWLDGEIAVLYSTPGVGKSSLAVQIAEGLAAGRGVPPFDKPRPGLEVEPQRVLYIDFELTLEQFAGRYTRLSDDGLSVASSYEFSPNLVRAELYWDGRLVDGYADFTDMLFADIGRLIEVHDARVLICDNLTFLTRGNTADAGTAFRLMNRLQELKRGHFISILAIAHTPKRKAWMPITENDLQGSIDIAKVADSMFTIGTSALSPDFRYIKHIKSRSGRIEYGAGSVLVYRLGKIDLAAGGGRLASQGLSASEIGQRLGVGKSTAHRWVSSGP